MHPLFVTPEYKENIKKALWTLDSHQRAQLFCLLPSSPRFIARRLNAQRTIVLNLLRTVPTEGTYYPPFQEEVKNLACYCASLKHILDTRKGYMEGYRLTENEAAKRLRQLNQELQAIDEIKHSFAQPNSIKTGHYSPLFISASLKEKQLGKRRIALQNGIDYFAVRILPENIGIKKRKDLPLPPKCVPPTSLDTLEMMQLIRQAIGNSCPKSLTTDQYQILLYALTNRAVVRFIRKTAHQALVSPKLLDAVVQETLEEDYSILLEECRLEGVQRDKSSDLTSPFVEEVSLDIRCAAKEDRPNIPDENLTEDQIHALLQKASVLCQQGYNQPLEQSDLIREEILTLSVATSENPSDSRMTKTLLLAAVGMSLLYFWRK